MSKGMSLYSYMYYVGAGSLIRKLEELQIDFKDAFRLHCIEMISKEETMKELFVCEESFEDDLRQELQKAFQSIIQHHSLCLAGDIKRIGG